MGVIFLSKGQIMVEFILAFLVILFIISTLILSLNYQKYFDKINLLGSKLSLKTCELENSLKYNYFETKKCGLFKKEDVYASEKYG